MLVPVTVLAEVDLGKYDGNPTPEDIRSWMEHWLASYVSFYAPHGIVGVSPDGEIIADHSLFAQTESR